MKISKFEVNNFRSIISPEAIEFGQYNVIIGVNNIGKSNLINALVLALNLVKQSSYMKVLRGDRRGLISIDRNQYNRERDFPKNIKNGERKNTIFKLTFQLDDDEKDELYKEYGVNISKQIVLRFYFSEENRGTYDVVMRGKANKKFNDNKHKIARYIANNLNPIYVPCIRTAEMSEEAFEEALEARMTILDEDTEYKRCLDVISQKQNEVLVGFQDEIRDIVARYIPSVAGINYQAYGGNFRENRKGGHLFIDDGVETALELKGDGIKSLTAIALISATSENKHSSVFCVEEPESHLHSDAIYGIKKILKEASEKSQVIIATHSPILIDKESLSNNIIISESGIRKAKKVGEIKELLGVRISDEYMRNEMVVLVEGESDERILETLIKHHPKYKGCLQNDKLKIVNMHGGTKATNLVVFYNSLLIKCFVLLDNDTCGIEERNNLLKKGLVENDDVFILSCADRTFSELEDFVLEDIYKDYIKTTYKVDIERSKMFKKDKAEWSTRLQKAFSEQGQILTDEIEKAIKIYIADQVVEKGEVALNPFRKDTLDYLVERILEKCNR